jgi:hypothetical protein
MRDWLGLGEGGVFSLPLVMTANLPARRGHSPAAPPGAHSAEHMPCVPSINLVEQAVGAALRSLILSPVHPRAV